MTERKSPTAVLREGPRALSDDQVREIEDSALAEVLHVDIDDVIEYVHKDLKSLPDFTTLYRKYLKQRWDVYDLDFAQDQARGTRAAQPGHAGPPSAASGSHPAHPPLPGTRESPAGRELWRIHRRMRAPARRLDRCRRAAAVHRKTRSRR